MSLIQNDSVVLIHYTLRDDDGDVLDTSAGGAPMPYLHGHANIVPGLERQLEGREVGYKAVLVVEPEEGYGELDGSEPQEVPRDAFPAEMELEEGMQFVVENDLGEQIPVWVVDVGDEVILLDTNHPLAGETLHFEIEVVAVRPATAEELQHGHPHGAHGDEGHHHGH